MNQKSQKESCKHPDPKFSVPKPKIIPQEVEEIGGIKGPEPTRYGDWEKNGRCIDF